MIKYPEDTKFQDSGDTRIGITARGIDVARYKNLDAVVLRPMLPAGKDGELMAGPVMEIPFSVVPEICEEILEMVNAPRPIEVFGQALDTKRVELTTEEYGRIKDLMGATEEFLRDGHQTLNANSMLAKALQAVLDLGLE